MASVVNEWIKHHNYLKGRLLCGLIVAVKKLPDIVVDDDQFQKEAAFLMGIQHQNVVRILGYCAESRWEMMEVEKGKGRYVFAEIRARMLCFEYMPNKGLDEYLSGTFYETWYIILHLFSLPFSEVYIVIRTQLNIEI